MKALLTNRQCLWPWRLARGVWTKSQQAARRTCWWAALARAAAAAARLGAGESTEALARGLLGSPHRLGTLLLGAALGH